MKKRHTQVLTGTPPLLSLILLILPLCVFYRHIFTFFSEQVRLVLFWFLWQKLPNFLYKNLEIRHHWYKCSWFLRPFCVCFRKNTNLYIVLRVLNPILKIGFDFWIEKTFHTCQVWISFLFKFTLILSQFCKSFFFAKTRVSVFFFIVPFSVWEEEGVGRGAQYKQFYGNIIELDKFFQLMSRSQNYDGIRIQLYGEGGDRREGGELSASHSTEIS